jgi:hypothetical protein
MLLSTGHADRSFSRLKMALEAHTAAVDTPAAPLADLLLDLLALLPLGRCGAPG